MEQIESIVVLVSLEDKTIRQVLIKKEDESLLIKFLLILGNNTLNVLDKEIEGIEIKRL